MTVLRYERNPEAIYRRSFELVRSQTDLSAIPDALEAVTVRLVHACGMPDIVGSLAWHGDVARAAGDALATGAPIIADCQMVADGIVSARLPASNEVVCTLNDRAVAGLATTRGTTRSAVAVELWRPHLAGAVVAIGNAPTALFRLIELLADEGCPVPAAILAFPVGFVGAAESKRALIEHLPGIPCLTLHGRRGGSAMAAAAVNALAREAC